MKTINEDKLNQEIEAIIQSLPIDVTTQVHPKNIYTKLLHILVTHDKLTPQQLLGMLRINFNSLQETANFIENAVENNILTNDEHYFWRNFKLNKSIKDLVDAITFPPPTTKPYTATNNKNLITNTSTDENLDLCIEYINKLNHYKFTLTDQQFNGDYGNKTNTIKQSRIEKEIKDHLSKYPSFYFNHYYDKRGRTYVNGYHLTYQGDDAHKYSITLKEKEIIKPLGYQYLLIELATAYGKGIDKLPFKDRAEYAAKHLLNQDIQDADEPCRFTHALKGIDDFNKGILSNVMVSLDATSSAIQIASLLTGDLNGMRLTNLTEGENTLVDCYTEIHKATGLQEKFSRKDCKNAVMTGVYGSLKIPEEVYGSNVESFWQAMETCLPQVMVLLSETQAAWNNKALSHDWSLPDGFDVSIPVEVIVDETATLLEEEFTVPHKIVAPKKNGRSLTANIIHSVDAMIVREMNRRCDFNPKVIHKILFMTPTYSEKPIEPKLKRLLKLYRKTRFFSARILDMITPDNIHLIPPKPLNELLTSLPDEPFKIITVHDCFRVHPNNALTLRMQYLQIAKEIHSSKILSSILEDITGTNPKYQINDYSNLIKLGHAIS